VRGRSLGFDNLQGITWLKVANIRLEASNSSRYLGKPNLPNGIIKNDTEHILFLRKPGYRSPTADMEQSSLIPTEQYARWFCPVWSDIPGASLKEHPAPYPLEIASRLIRMFSFAGDVVLDPFAGTGTTAVAAMEAGKDVLCEKPMALTVPDCDDMLESARRHRRKLMAGQVLRFMHPFVDARRLIVSHKLGQPLSASLTRIVGGGLT